MMVCLWCCYVVVFGDVVCYVVCDGVCYGVCDGVSDVMSDGVSSVMDAVEVEWLILGCFGVLIYDGRTDGQTYERTDICTSRVAFATENKNVIVLIVTLIHHINKMNI